MTRHVKLGLREARNRGEREIANASAHYELKLSPAMVEIRVEKLND